MRLTLLIFTLFICDSIYAQIKFKEKLPSLVMTFCGGATDGVRDASLFHMSGKGKFWDGSISWRNKYLNGDPLQGPRYFGSTNFLVWTTDAPHLFNAFTHQFNSFAIAMAPQREKKLGKILLDAVMYNVARQMGHSLMYGVILK